MKAVADGPLVSNLLRSDGVRYEDRAVVSAPPLQHREGNTTHSVTGNGSWGSNGAGSRGARGDGSVGATDGDGDGFCR